MEEMPTVIPTLLQLELHYMKYRGKIDKMNGIHREMDNFTEANINLAKKLISALEYENQVIDTERQELLQALIEQFRRWISFDDIKSKVPDMLFVFFEGSVNILSDYLDGLREYESNVRNQSRKQIKDEILKENKLTEEQLIDIQKKIEKMKEAES